MIGLIRKFLIYIKHFKSEESSTFTLFDQFADLEKKALVDSFEVRNDIMKKCNDVLYGGVIQCRQKKLQHHEAIWSSCLFLNTIALDLSYLVEDLTYERDDWKRRYIARSLSLLMYEVGEDLPTVFGKKCIDAMKSLSIPSDLQDDFKSKKKKVSAFWHSNRAELKEIRTIAVAHFDHDPVKILQTIEGMDLFKLLQTGVELGKIVNELGSVSQKIMNNSVEGV